MKERIKAVRKYYQKSQDDFAISLQLTKNYISLVETGKRSLSSRTIKDICRIYNVNETWLLTGEGEMFSPLSREEEIAQMVAKVFNDDDPFRFKLMSLIAQMDENQIELIKDIVKELYEASQEK